MLQPWFGTEWFRAIFMGFRFSNYYPSYCIWRSLPLHLYKFGFVWSIFFGLPGPLFWTVNWFIATISFSNNKSTEYTFLEPSQSMIHMPVWGLRTDPRIPDKPKHLGPVQGFLTSHGLRTGHLVLLTQIRIFIFSV